MPNKNLRGALACNKDRLYGMISLGGLASSFALSVSLSGTHQHVTKR